MVRIAARVLFCGGALLLLAALLAPASLHACAVCIDGSANDPVTDAFNWSVLFLMASPYAIFGSIGGWIFYHHWRRDAGQTGGAQKDKAYWIWTPRESER